MPTTTVRKKRTSKKARKRSQSKKKTRRAKKSPGRTKNLFTVTLQFNFERSGNGESSGGTLRKLTLVCAANADEADALALAGARSALEQQQPPTPSESLLDRFVKSMHRMTLSNPVVIQSAQPVHFEQKGLIGFLSA